MMLSAPLMLVIIGLGSLLAQWLAWLLKIPAILPLLLLGVVLGPVTHVIQHGAEKAVRGFGKC
jgi:NhaP-type Na+/H+ or K+/H+ antiporter